MSKQEEASLILKLYGLRREEVLRKARTWFIQDFYPESIADFNGTMLTEHGAYIRMVVTYWDMAAALVNDGAISLDLFNKSNLEHIVVFSKIEKLLPEIRASFVPTFAKNLEELIDAMPDGRKTVAALRERMATFRALRAKH